MAYVLSSVSGNLISAASAGFAPTNSADVSAIASAYQVVSATATQLYAGTAYVTSVNEAPISAARAGQAANASLATSAYYDGTGRLISALPDSAAVSAIASSYAESAASSKLDESASSNFYPSDNPSGFISGVDLTDYATTAYVDSSISSFVDSAYVESQVSGKEDKLTFGYEASSISSINGSALAGGMITSIASSLDPWYHTAISGLNGSSIYPKWAESAQNVNFAESASLASYAQSAGGAPTAWASSFITGVASPSGTIRVLGGTAIESTNSAVLPSTVIEGFSVVGVCAGSTTATSFTVPFSNPNTRVHLGDAYANGTFAIDTDNGIHDEAVAENEVDLWFDIPFATSFTATYPWVSNLGYTASASAHEEGGGVGTLAWASSLPTYQYDAENKISSINGSAIAGGSAGVDSATCSAIASAYAESAASSKLDSSASSSFYGIDNPSGFLTAAYTPTFGYNTADQISSIDGSALGGMDEAAVSGIASAYAESAVSSVSGNYYTTANESGFLTAQAQASWSESASASPSYIQDKPDLVDIVAGPGIVVDNPDGNTLRVSVDQSIETVLWEGDTQPIRTVSSTINLSESVMNFELIRFEGLNSYAVITDALKFANTVPANSEMCFGNNLTISNGTVIVEAAYATVSGTSLTLIGAGRGQSNASGQMSFRTDRGPTLYKVVGIHRIANN